MTDTKQRAREIVDTHYAAHSLNCSGIVYITAIDIAESALSERGEADRRAIAWIVQTEHHGECYQFSDEFVERFPGAPADLTPFTPPAPLDVAALRITDEMVERAARAICTTNRWDPDAPVEYAGTRKKVKDAGGETLPQWRLHEQNARAALESILASGGKGE